MAVLRQDSTQPALKKMKTSGGGSGAQRSKEDIAARADTTQAGEAKKKLTTHVGRFQKVARNKHVKGYSATDLAAILGANGNDEVLLLTVASSVILLPDILLSNSKTLEVMFSIC